MKILSKKISFFFSWKKAILLNTVTAPHVNTLFYNKLIHLKILSQKRTDEQQYSKKFQNTKCDYTEQKHTGSICT